jgi:pimeloyl-ACP methyl ester carboxylesterase
MILKRVRRLLACRLALFSSRGLALLECSTPLTSFSYTGVVPREALIVFLPGIGDFAEDFEGRGFINALVQSGLNADAIAVDAHYGYYARRNVLERLAEDVVLPARSQGYRQVWLVGISMGGIGALSYVMHHPGHIARVLLLAPYLGEPAWIREAIDAQDPTTPPPAEFDTRVHVRRLWRWIRDHHREQTVRPSLYLGYGSRDRFAKANALFAAHLPPGHVLTTAGGHDWRTWQRLWQAFLAMWTAKTR